MPSASIVFVDSHVLLYAEDGADKLKHRAARGWLRPPMPAGDARAEVRRYQRWQPWLVDHATVESAWAIESRNSISYWDALMVAAAQHLGCTMLLTEDLQHDQTFDSLRVVNPFLVGPELLDPRP